MTTTPLTEAEVLAAAATIIDAFAATDTGAYFDCFSEDATFVFHTEPQRLGSRQDYERLWAGWLHDGWKVTDCVSTDQRVQLLGPAAVFTHDVRTTTTTGGATGTTEERETIVFLRTAAGIEAVHEHLSPVPEVSPDSADSTEKGTP